MNADFAMAIHFHQPVGNFDYVIERACDRCYMPFLSTLQKYPLVKMSFHFSGCLLEWIEKKRPEIIKIICEMIKTGQIEIMGGAFYEPILSSIPPEDRIRQIEMLKRYIHNKLSFKVRGAWVAERVWEPELPSLLYDAGVKYVILDDTHFLYSGISKDKTYGYYITEDNAKPIAVFPSDKVLRYNMPFKMPAESIDYMRNIAIKHTSPLFIYGDDGEKFGEWPGTHKWVFQEKWLQNFLSELENNTDWLRIVTLSECLENRAPLGRIYLGTSSYEEMCKWALPVESQNQMENVIRDIQTSGKEEFYKPFIRGGFWRNFLSKYSEANHMHKKMIYVSRKLEQLRADKNSKGSLEEAEKELFRGQCNCAYWHGVFGGLYLFHLRNAVFHHLIKSEVLMDEVLYGKKQFCQAQIFDFNSDRFDEIILENKKMALYFAPAEGGILKELDSKPDCQNLINSLARRKEVYHKDILESSEESSNISRNEVKAIHNKERIAGDGIKDYLNYDYYSRYSLIDHFLSPDTNINTFADAKYAEAGDFINAVYNFKIKRLKDNARLIMSREGLVSGKRIFLQKKIIFLKDKSELSVSYNIQNKTNDSIDLIFAPEFNLTMPNADSEQYSIVFGNKKKGYTLREKIEEKQVRELTFKDNNGSLLKMGFSNRCSLWSFPLKTVSQSEKAYELNYQSTVILPHINLKLAAGKGGRFTIKIELV